MKGKLVGEIKRLFAKREPLNLTAVKRRHAELVERVYAADIVGVGSGKLEEEEGWSGRATIRFTSVGHWTCESEA